MDCDNDDTRSFFSLGLTGGGDFFGTEILLIGKNPHSE